MNMSKHLHGSHVLFIVRNSQAIGSLISYLGTRRVKSWTASNLEDAVTKIVENEIDVVFLSINVKGIQVGPVVKSLALDHKVPTIVFAEEDSRKSELELVKMNIPNKILPPNQNSKVWRALLSAVDGAELANKTEGLKQNLLPENASQIAKTELPKEGRWIKLDPDSKSPPPFTFKLILPRGSGASRQRFYYVGNSNPSTGDTPGTFYGVGSIGRFTTEEKPFEEGGDTGLPYRLAQMGEEVGKKLAGLEVEKLQPTNSVEECLQEAASLVEKLTQPIPFEKGPSNQFMVSLIKTESSEGYLITTLSEEQILEATAFSELIDIIREKLKFRGEKIIELSPPLLFEHDMLDFVSWAQASSYYVVLIGQDESRLSYTFVEAPLEDVILTLEKEDMFSVALPHMRTDIKLTFDLYLHLPKNDKYVLYRRKGTMLTESAIENFSEHAIEKIYVNKSDKNAYYAYRAASYVMSNRKKAS